MHLFFKSFKMDHKIKYLLNISILTVVVLGIYSLLRFMGVLILPQKLYLLLVIMMFVLVYSGSAIALLGKYKYPESFGQRFLLMTTFQMMTFLSVAAAAKYALEEEANPFVLQYLFVFLAVLFVQSIFLVKLGKNIKSEEEIEQQKEQGL